MTNLLTELMGTPGVGIVSGVRVFHHTGPTATSYTTPGDTGTVYVANPDGRGYFTAADQPFFKYDEVLLPGDTSEVKTWHWHVPQQVATFSFTVMVEAALPSETSLPPIPAAGFSYPGDTILNPITDKDPNVRYYASYVGIEFDDTTSLAGYYRTITKYHATLVGGAPDATHYDYRVPLAGTTLSHLNAKLDSISAEPGVKYAFPFAYWTRAIIHSRAPDDLAALHETALSPTAVALPMLSANPALTKVPPIGVIASFNCQVEVREAKLTCRDAELPAPSAAIQRAPIGGSGAQIRSTNVAYDAAASDFRADVSLTNLLTERMGTPGAGIVSGVCVFLHTGPTATSYNAPGDTGTVYVANPDGRGYFTAADQPFFKYDEVLLPGDTSEVKTWHWYVPPQVATFAFTVMVEAALPTDTALPPVPLEAFRFSDDTLANPITEAGPGVRYYPTYVGIKFDDTTSLVTYHRIINKHSAVLIAGSAATSEYVFRIPNPGTNLVRFGALVDSISAERGVTYAYPLAFWRNTRVGGGTPAWAHGIVFEYPIGRKAGKAPQHTPAFAITDGGSRFCLSPGSITGASPD